MPNTKKRELRSLLKLKTNRAHLAAGLLCLLLGFAVVAQISQTRDSGLTGLRQSDLVRVLDDANTQVQNLQSEVRELEAQRQELVSGTNQQQLALEQAQENAKVQGILSGRLPAEGPGITLRISNTDGQVTAGTLVAVLQELRNAGAEVTAVNDVRVTVTSSFTDSPNGVVLDQQVLEYPIEWKIIVDPQVAVPALNIPGGAMAQVRTSGATAAITEHELVRIDAVAKVSEMEWAEIIPKD